MAAKNQKSPFTPGSPVPVELFVGRKPQVEEIIEMVTQSVFGTQTNIFLVGERGVGKTSMASFAQSLTSERNILAIHVFLGGVDNLQEMVRRTFDTLLQVSQKESWFQKVRGLFGEVITEIGLFNLSVSFAPAQKDLDGLVRNFPEALANFLASTDKEGLFVALDDIDALSAKPEFANWYKSFVDKVATQFNEFPVSVMVIGLPEIMDNLTSAQPSLMRIFRVIELEKLSNKEVEQFFIKAFAQAKIRVEDEALALLIKFSSGVPVIMHEIGDATFWADKDGSIDNDDALHGVLIAANRIGKKYLDPQVYRAIRSPRYRSILRKMGRKGTPLKKNFSRKEIAQYLTPSEKNVLDNFLRKLKKIGIITSDVEAGRGYYRFINDIYPVYIFMEALAAE